jgi:hypothetical protein
MDQNHAIVCLKCGRLALPGENFGAACTAPLTAHAVCDPFDVIRTEGFIYREASQHPEKLIVVIGMVILFGPTFVIAVLGVTVVPLIFLLDARHKDLISDWGALLLALIICGAWAAISGKLLYRTIGNYYFPDRLRAAEIIPPQMTETSPKAPKATDEPTAQPSSPPVNLGEKRREYLRKQGDKGREEGR